LKFTDKFIGSVKSAYIPKYSPTKNINKYCFHFKISHNWRGIPLKENNKKTREARKNFFKGLRKEGDLDESTFDVWKSELQKDLPTFWESMTDSRRK
jgi:hypothetical protein